MAERILTQLIAAVQIEFPQLYPKRSINFHPCIWKKTTDFIQRGSERDELQFISVTEEPFRSFVELSGDMVEGVGRAVFRVLKFV